MRRLFVSYISVMMPLALTLAFTHCSSVPSYEISDNEPDSSSTVRPEAEAGGPRDASVEATTDATQEPDGCVPITIDARKPAVTDTCRWATPLAWETGSVRFGTLDSPAFAVTTSYVFFVSRGQLWRVPRSTWNTPGGDSFERCDETTLGPVMASEVQQILPFDTDGVCVHLTSGGRTSVRCAGNSDTALVTVPDLTTEEEGGSIARDGQAITTSGGYLVFARASGYAFRYAAGTSAPVAYTDPVVYPETIGRLTATGNTVVASRFKLGQGHDLMYFDPRLLKTQRSSATVPWPDDTAIVSFAQVGTELAALSDKAKVWALVGGGTLLFSDVSLLVGSRSSSDSFAVTLQKPTEGTPATFEIITPSVSGVLGDANTERRKTPALLATNHRAIIDGDDLYVATMPAFGCAAGMAWIAKLPRLLQQ